jgi:hypothetical protein
MIDRNKQTGLTTLTWLLVVMVAGFFLVCLVKLGPVYMESLTVNSIITQAAEEARGEGLGKAQIHERIAKKMLINTIAGMSMADVEISGQGEDMIIDATYEVRKPLMLNIDVVLKFDDMIVAIN